MHSSTVQRSKLKKGKWFPGWIFTLMSAGSAESGSMLSCGVCLQADRLYDKKNGQVLSLETEAFQAASAALKKLRTAFCILSQVRYKFR